MEQEDIKEEESKDSSEELPEDFRKNMVSEKFLELKYSNVC